MDVAMLRARALEDMRARVHRVEPHQWDAPTPCSRWSVRDLVGHVTAENLWSVDIVAGRTLDEVGDRYEGDVLGDDPVAAFDAAADASIAAFVPGRIRTCRVHTSMGRIDLEHYLLQMFTDALVHGWDLAVATGQSATLDPELADICHGMLVETTGGDLEGAREAGLFAPPVRVSEDAPVADRLLGLLGRDPRAGDRARPQGR